MTVSHAHRFYFTLAPVISLVSVLVCFAVVPFSERFYVADISLAVLYVMAFSSLGVYGILLGGWSSNNKYSLMGGLRGAAQMISYEIPLALALVGVVVLAGSLSLVEIVRAQQGAWFIVKQPLGFLLFLVAVSAETNRTPFDLIECENELVAGYQTEYASMKFGLFYMAEYAHLLLASCLVTLLFLGGWNGPVLPALAWFGIKLFLVFFVFIWVRATFPRVRYDQLMMFSWKVLTPLAFLNLLVTAVFVVYPL
jgi:NADH-quinone oxidoreductase subunit H